MKKTLMIFLFMLLAQCALAKTCCDEPVEPARYSGLAYFGCITQNTLGQVVGFNYEFDNEKLYSVEVARYFASDSGIRIFFGKLISRFALSFNFTYHDDPQQGSIYEFNPHIYAAWHLFTLQHFLSAHIAVGEGLSYLTEIPTRERRNSQDPKKLMNYLMFELVLGSPTYPEWELVGRIHHRSGVFGLYNANNSGSTAVGVALRYYFL